MPPLILIYLDFSVFWAFKFWCPFARLFDLRPNSSSVLLQQSSNSVWPHWKTRRGNGCVHRCERKKRKLHIRGDSLIRAAKEKQRKKPPKHSNSTYPSLWGLEALIKPSTQKQNQFSQAVVFTGICVICFPTGKSKHPLKKINPLNLGYAA